MSVHKLACMNTYGLCEWLTKKGITDFVSHIQAWNYDGQQLVALTEDQILSLEICEASKKKLLKVIYPNSAALSNGGILSRFRKQKSASASGGGASFDGNDGDFDDDEWDDGEFDDDEFDDGFDQNSAAPPPQHQPPQHQPPQHQPPQHQHSLQQTPVDDLMSQDYYNPHMDRYGAERVLQSAQVDGSFVVRNSSKVTGEYSLSLLYQGHIRHLRIRRRLQDGMFALGESKPGEKFFANVVELVMYHRSEPINLQSGGYTVLTYGYR